jgi:23S rRNA (guanosine2251-2'-O)-methyltransferase
LHHQESLSARRQVRGVREINAALRSNEKPRLLLIRRAAEDPEVLAIVEQAAKLGIPVRRASANDLRRMNAADPPEDVLALLGPDPGADEATVLASGGAVWLLVKAAYPGNVGFAIRTAEVSGADGIFIDTDVVGRGRHRALRASMGANRFFPVHWLTAERAIGLARETGKRIIAVENTGSGAHWDADLTGSILLIIGGEEEGISTEILGQCDDIVRIPMAGFVPSYNLHAAMAAVAVERLRQLANRSRRI